MKHLWLLLALIPTLAQAEWKPQYAEAPQEVRDWYHSQEVNPEAQGRLNLPFKSCCGSGDTFHTRFRLLNDGSKYGAETYEYEQDGKWKLVPSDIIKRAKTPDGRPKLFLRDKTLPICFIIDEEGI